jgi:hypothetical protein
MRWQRCCGLGGTAVGCAASEPIWGSRPRRYQSSETDVVLGISRQGDAMARHYL